MGHFHAVSSCSIICNVETWIRKNCIRERERDTDCLKGQSNRHIAFAGKQEGVYSFSKQQWWPFSGCGWGKFLHLGIFKLLLVLGNCAAHLCLYSRESEKLDVEKYLLHLPNNLAVPKPHSPLSAIRALFQPFTLNAYSVLSQKPDITSLQFISSS